MKSVLSVLVLFFASSFCLLASGDSSVLTGTWKSSNKGDIYFYQFGADSTLKIVHGKDTAYAWYNLDTAQMPMHLDMKMLGHAKEYLYTSPGIFEWIGPGRIRIRMSNNMVDRPLSFMPKGNLETYVLVKQP